MLKKSPLRSHERTHFFKYVTASVAKTVLTNTTLRWSSPARFNDPFDVPRQLNVGFSEAELQTAVATEFAAILEEDRDSDDSKIMELQAVLRRQGDAALRKDIGAELRNIFARHLDQTGGVSFDPFRKMWDDLMPGLRILCLSEVNDATPMWFHYADQDRGAVLEFECHDDLDSALLLARRVTYRDAAPALPPLDTWVRALTGQGTLDLKELFSEHHYIKSTDWSYEHEWRVQSYAREGDTGSYADLPFHPGELSGVYFGSEISEQDRADIHRLLPHTYGHVAVYRARPDSTRRRFVFDRDPSTAAEQDVDVDAAYS